MVRFLAIWLLVLGVTGSAVAREAAPEQPRHLIYLHGAIVAIQGLPAVHPVFGEYAFDDIVQACVDSGFVVHAAVRQRQADVWVPARQTAAVIDSLLADGVAADHITVVGASAGGFIAGLVSHLTAEADIRYVLLGVCSEGAEDWWQQQGVQLHGRVLSIHEKTDTGRGACARSFARCADSVSAVAEVEVATGRQHGFLYQPLDAWLTPAVAWARAGNL